MSINDDKKDGLISKLPKSVVYRLLGIGFVIGIIIGGVGTILYSNNMKNDYENLIYSLEKGALAQCIPVNLLASGQATTVYLEEICNFASRLGAGIDSANVENTIRIHEADADILRTNLNPTIVNTGQPIGAVFSIPEMLKVLIDASNVTRISDTLISLENLGLGIVYGRYPGTRPPYISSNTPYNVGGANTCYIEFVDLSRTTSDGNNTYYEPIMGPIFRYPNERVTSSLSEESIIFNFPRLCPTYCPPSTQPEQEQ